MSNPKVDFHNWQYQCTYQIWWKSIEIYSSYCPESKIKIYRGQISLSKMDKIHPLAIPKQMSTISMHMPSLVKIHWYLLKISRNENTDLSWADISVKNWWNLPISNPKADLHNINAHTKFGENPLTFTIVIIRKWEYGPVSADNWWNLPIHIIIIRFFSNGRPRWRSWMRVRLQTRRSQVRPPPRSATFFRGDWSWNIFYGHSLPSADSRRAVVSFWWKNVHNTGLPLGGLSLSSKRVVK